MMKFTFPYTERQRQMVTHPARILWIGTATKTGKSAASYAWLVEGLLRGESCAFVGPWFFRARRAFDEIKNLLEPWIRTRAVKVNEARLQIVAGGGAYLDFLSADNPDCLFGGNYSRLVLDESSRMPEAIHGAALTTISATNGKLRCLFNLELGSRNWSIRNLLRVQRLSPEDRVRTGEDFMTFPTDSSLVDPALVEMLRSQMPLPLYEALYLAKIPDSDCSLFRNLERIFTGKELEGPLPDRQYMMAADLARKTDWTVVTIIDDLGRVVAGDRFNQISWGLQVERAAMLYRTFHCKKVILDATGVGDPVQEEFEERGLNVEGFIFTMPSRRLLIEELVLACDNAEIAIPENRKFAVYRAELESMEYQLDGTTIRYAVPGNMHDDCVMSLALAVHAFRASRGAVLGMILLLERRAKEIAAGIRDSFGELVHRAPKPVPVATVQKPGAPRLAETRVEGNKGLAKEPKCPACKSAACVIRASVAGGFLCNGCAATFDQSGNVTSSVANGPCCGLPMPSPIPGGERCMNCGSQRMDLQPVGVSRAQFVSRKSTYGRFG